MALDIYTYNRQLIQFFPMLSWDSCFYQALIDRWAKRGRPLLAAERAVISDSVGTGKVPWKLEMRRWQYVVPVAGCQFLCCRIRQAPLITVVTRWHTKQQKKIWFRGSTKSSEHVLTVFCSCSIITHQDACAHTRYANSKWQLTSDVTVQSNYSVLSFMFESYDANNGQNRIPAAIISQAFWLNPFPWRSQEQRLLSQGPFQLVQRHASVADFINHDSCLRKGADDGCCNIAYNTGR